MSVIKRIGGAFIVGMGCGLIGQILMTVVGTFIPDATMTTLISMLIFGFIGVALIVSGVYLKIAKFGGDGAAIPLCGLMFGAAAASAEMQKAGIPKGKAILGGFVKIIIVLGIGFIIAFAVGLFIH